MSNAAAIRLALVGNPNCGKTALFNLLTGSRQKVANYAGVTVERKEGRFHGPSGRHYALLDLPGTSQYRLDAGASGFSNLLLAGDWVFTGLGGAVESAVIGGMQAAEAASGQSLGIIGALANPWSRLPRYQR